MGLTCDQPSTVDADSALLNPSEIIEAMIDLRIQFSELDQKIKTLQPSFYNACVALNTDKIALERATITRRVTPGQWDYSADILEHEALLKQLRQQFQERYEPTRGREVIWAIKLLLSVT